MAIYQPRVSGRHTHSSSYKVSQFFRKGVHIWPFPPAVTEEIQPLFVLALLVALDLIRLRKRLPLIKYMPGTDTKIDHISHLAGYGSGIVAAQFLRPESRGKQQNKTGR